jgi:shikimate kinase
VPKTPIENIALIGFMAVGKSAIGRTLAKKLRRRFVDLDAVIEKSEGMKVRDIFTKKGESYFRQLEKRVLEEVLSRDGQVIATGGGAVMDDDNLRLLRERALLVGLTASVDVLLARAGNGAKRPLLAGIDRRERIETLLRERESRYAQARALIDTSDLSVDQAAEKIVQLLCLKKTHADSHRSA